MEECYFLLKLTLLHGCFSRFLNCTTSTKSCKTSHFIWSLKSWLEQILFELLLEQWKIVLQLFIENGGRHVDVKNICTCVQLVSISVNGELIFITS